MTISINNRFWSRCWKAFSSTYWFKSEQVSGSLWLRLLKRSTSPVWTQSWSGPGSAAARRVQVKLYCLTTRRIYTAWCAHTPSGDEPPRNYFLEVFSGCDASPTALLFTSVRLPPHRPDGGDEPIWKNHLQWTRMMMLVKRMEKLRRVHKHWGRI